MSRATKKIIKRLCAKRWHAGMRKYGIFDPQTDSRNFAYEALCEVLDAINYIHMARAVGAPLPNERAIRYLLTWVAGQLLRRVPDVESDL